MLLLYTTYIYPALNTSYCDLTVMRQSFLSGQNHNNLNLTVALNNYQQYNLKTLLNKIQKLFTIFKSQNFVCFLFLPEKYNVHINW